ncbi:hypothetical protein F442_09547 [Phytophthora nicotianae P10297]|uniref:Uncharacterized protein n=1 Tax=Phytophthora nicotianae P10297 TaxID=1317064 RepID=W2ZC75_PHYNI|nr:hypothetical protein F442_09547 [Phytophthora nicotianae P10297]
MIRGSALRRINTVSELSASAQQSTITFPSSIRSAYATST